MTGGYRVAAGVLVSLAGVGSSLYVLLYLTGALSGIWDPFFSRYATAVTDYPPTLPYSAAGVVVFAAGILLSAFLGRRSAGRLLFALATLYSAAGVVFAILQPLVAGGWSFWCLLSAALALALSGLSAEGALGVEPDTRPALARLPRLAAVLFGVWFAMSPYVVGYAGTPAGVSDTITGTILAAVAFLALWPSLGRLRFLELVAGAWVFIVPFFMQYNAVHGQYNILPEVFHICIGLMLAGFSFLGGERRTSSRTGADPLPRDGIRPAQDRE
ncbi:MAG: SPW repeat protein [Rubrobacteraceae bacterium]|nr:SPW repeat protein [Rubrobacteraceae bacterium]